MPWRGLLLLLTWWASTGAAWALSVLTYNVSGNGTTDWSTNSLQVQAIGRQMLYLQPDVVTFLEIPFTNTWQMAAFVQAFLPGYFLATNSGTDGFIRSVIASRHPIARSQKWLDGVSLANFGYDGNFTRDLFEAEVNVPNYAEHVHVFTTHLKAQSDTNSAARRAAEAGAISNFFVTTFLPAYGQRPYVLTGDLNEDINRPPSSSQQPLPRLVNAGTGLRLTTPRNPFNNDDRTISIRSSLMARFDYILPGGMLFSNISTSQVFRTDVLTPRPAPLLSTDSRTASDHLPVLMTFNNPYDAPFRLLSVTASNQAVTLNWESAAGRHYHVEDSSNLVLWAALATNLTANGSNLTFTTNPAGSARYFRIYRVP